MSAIEQWQDPSEISDQQLASIQKQAAIYANSKIVPKHLQGKPDDITAIALTARGLGMPLTISVLKKFFVVNGGAEPMAQVMVGLALSHGHDVWQISPSGDEESATYAGRRRGATRVDHFTFTIEDARRAHLLDSWVEKWRKDGQNWKLEDRCVVAVDGADIPEDELPDWALRLIGEGKLKRNDAWFNWRPDMLSAAASRRAVRGTCPEVLLGMDAVVSAAGPEDLDGSVGVPPSSPAASAPVVQHEASDDDDDIVDAEIVEDGEGAPDHEPAGEADTTVDQPVTVPTDDERDVVSSGWRQHFAIVAKDQGWTDDQRHEILSFATKGRVRSSKDLWRAETNAVVQTVNRLKDGELRFIELDGAWHIGPRSPEGGPEAQQETFFEESA
ncbi:MAG: hypothetical protein H0W70_15820 [Actinobacteria bacterium]|nr:hypothetical protein [Actinomycetota bacterium]